jgi:hypothetical protein
MRRLVAAMDRRLDDPCAPGRLSSCSWLETPPDRILSPRSMRILLRMPQQGMSVAPRPARLLAGGRWKSLERCWE